MKMPPGDIDIEFIEPDGGIDPNRLSLALRMLISEKDIIEYFTSLPLDFKPAGSPNHSRNKSARISPSSR